MISIDKQYRTRDGSEVRIYSIQGGGVYPVHGAVYVPGAGCWSLTSLTGRGSHEQRKCYHHLESPEEGLLDLVEVKPRIKRTVWINLHSDGHDFLHATKELADLNPAPFSARPRLACVKVEIDCEEGEGLGD